MDGLNMTDRRDTCRYCLAMPDLQKPADGPARLSINYTCAKDPEDPKSIPDAKICDTCPHYKSKFIEFPITVQEIQNDDVEPFPSRDGTRPTPIPCIVSLVDDTFKDQKYLGLYLGDWPWILTNQFAEKKGLLRNRIINNPMIYVFGLNRLVYGAECWWLRLNNMEDLDKELNTLNPEPLPEYLALVKTLLQNK